MTNSLPSETNDTQTPDQSSVLDDHSPEKHGVLGSVVNWFAHNAIAANLLMVLVIVCGWFAYTHINKESFPEIEPNFIGINVVYNSGDARQSEEGITLKIENALEQVDGIKRITSFSQPMGSRVTVQKKSDYPLETLLTDIKSKVDSIPNLPKDAEKPVITEAKFIKDALWIDIYGDVEKEVLIETAQRIKTDLLAQSAIQELTFSGLPEKIVSVEIDDQQLQQYALTINDISQAINAESLTSFSTSIRDGKKQIRLAAAEQDYYAKDFEQIPIITTSDGTVIRLGDIAEIRDTFEDEPQIIARYNSKPSVGIKLFSGKNTDISKVVTQANAVIQKWQPNLPQGVSAQTWLDQSKNINARLKLLFDNALFGFVLVFIILALFLHIKVAFWVAAGLPFVFFGTFYLMGNYADLTINYITTFGFIMALGIVVDDAVVVGESVYSVRKRYGDTVKSTVAGTLAVSKPTILGVLTTVVTFLSLANITGDIGKIYAQFGYVVAFCLLLSIVESKFILPAHLSHLNTQADKKKQRWNPLRRLQQAADASMNWMNRQFQRAIHVVLAFRYAAILVLFALFVFVVGLPLSGKVRVVFFPDIPGDVLMVRSTVKSEAGFSQNYKNLDYIEQVLYQVDQDLLLKAQQKEESQPSSDHNHRERNTRLKTGLKSVQVFSDSDLNGRILIELKKDIPYSSRDLIALWKEKTGTPSGTKTLQFVSNFMRGDNFNVEIKGSDSALITAAGLELKRAIQTIEGVSGIEDNLTPNTPQIKFKLTPEGRALGFTTAQVAQQVLQNFGGGVVQRFQRDKDEVKVRVRFPKASRSSLDGLQRANVRTPDGSVVPLSLIADMTQAYTTDEIRRINGQRVAVIKAQLNKRVIAPSELVNQLKTSHVPNILAQYPGIDIHFAGEAEEQGETARSMQQTFMVTLLVIYMILAVALSSYAQPLLIMAVIPFGVVGAIIGHWITGLSISIFSLNGILALTGVVINDSLLLVSKYNENTAKGMLPTESIAEAASSRFRAVVLTSLTTFAGLLPLLFETSHQAQFLKPAAASLAYGILFATVITLVLIPLLVSISQDVKFWKKPSKVQG